MTQKFGRNYRLTIFPLDGGPPIIVTMPFTIAFTLRRDIGSDLNRMDIEIYNLSEQNRNRIFKDRYDLGKDTSNLYYNLILEIGYSNLYRVFQGAMWQAGSSREGTNIITKIECRQGNYDVAGTQTFQTLQAGQTLGDVLKFLIGQFPSLQLGAVGDFPEVMSRPVVLNGNTWDLLKQYSNNQVYVDNGKIYVLKNNEVLASTTLINASTGLLDTPRREEGFLTISTLLEAGINIGELVQLQSTIQPSYDGTYKVISVTHQGMISQGVCGYARSIFGLLAPNQFDGFKVVSQPTEQGSAA